MQDLLGNHWKDLLCNFVTKTEIIDVLPRPILMQDVYEFLEDVDI